MLETINEAVEVLALFTGGKASPLRFRWRTKVVKVSKVTGQWMRHEGEARLYFYSVLGDTSDYFELCYDGKALTWTLSKVWMAG